MSQHPGITTGTKLYEALQQRKYVIWTTRYEQVINHPNEYLHHFNIIETPEYECGSAKEMVDHYLFNSGLYDKERDKLRRNIDGQGIRSSILLGDHKRIRNTEDLSSTGDNCANYVFKGETIEE